MLDRGYKLVSGSTDRVDVFQKLPVYNFEFHRELYEKDRDVFYNYYKDVKKRLIKDNDNKCGYHFSDEDFYIYMISHIYKHFYHSGTGIRSLIDVYLYIENKSLDWKYLKHEFEKLQIARFEKIFRIVAYRLFETPVFPDIENLTQEEKELIEYLLESGIYGNETKLVLNRLNFYVPGKMNGILLIKYLCYRLFPRKGWLKIHKPEIYGHKGRVFIYYISRLMKAIRKGPYVIKEFKIAYRQKGKENKKQW